MVDGAMVTPSFAQLAVNTPVTPDWVLVCQADGEPGNAPDRRWAAELAPARVVFPGGETAVPGQQRRWGHGEDLRPAPARDEPGERSGPGPVGGVISHPAGVPAQHCILVPEHQQPGVLCPVPPERQDNQAE